jgi:hypothetical protein
LKLENKTLSKLILTGLLLIFCLFSLIQSITGIVTVNGFGFMSGFFATEEAGKTIHSLLMCVNGGLNSFADIFLIRFLHFPGKSRSLRNAAYGFLGLSVLHFVAILMPEAVWSWVDRSDYSRFQQALSLFLLPSPHGIFNLALGLLLLYFAKLVEVNSDLISRG